MSYASWYGVPQTIANNTTITQVSQNGSNYTTDVNIVPQVISRTLVLSTMQDEVNTIFFTASNVPPGLYKAGMWWQVGTGAADPWQPRDFTQFFVCAQDYLNTPSNSNAANFYKTRNSVTVPYTEGADPIGSSNGTTTGQHCGFLNVSSIQNVSWVAYMEDFNDVPISHAVAMTDAWLQKIG